MNIINDNATQQPESVLASIIELKNKPLELDHPQRTTGFIKSSIQRVSALKNTVSDVIRYIKVQANELKDSISKHEFQLKDNTTIAFTGYLLETLEEPRFKYYFYRTINGRTAVIRIDKFELSNNNIDGCYDQHIVKLCGCHGALRDIYSKINLPLQSN